MNELNIMGNCKVCCDCVNICPQEVLGIVGGKVKVLDLKKCTFCEECVDICQQNNIEMRCEL